MASHGILPKQITGLKAQYKRRVVLWCLLTISLVALDQYTKSLASEYLAYAQPVVVSDYLNWTLLHNTGAAFSFLNDAGGWQNGFFCLVALVVCSYIVYLLYRVGISGEDRWNYSPLALILVLAGAVGNLYDRLTLGYVVDFIQLHYQHYYWPAFNVADSAISVGAVMLILSTLLASDPK
jgi:signal peptidase II